MFEDYRIDDDDNTDDDAPQSLNKQNNTTDNFDVVDDDDMSSFDVSEKEQRDTVFREFIPHINALYNFAYHLSLDENDANDLLQETLLKAYRSTHSYVGGSNAKAWLFKILKNTFINEYRRRNRLPQQIDYEEIGQYHDSEDPDQGKYLDLRHEIFQDMLGDEVTKAINSIPVAFKTAVLLCDVEGFTYDEMSKILDIPVGTVRSRLNRGRSLLKNALRDYGTKMGYVD